MAISDKDDCDIRTLIRFCIASRREAAPPGLPGSLVRLYLAASLGFFLGEAGLAGELLAPCLHFLHELSPRDVICLFDPLTVGETTQLEALRASIGLPSLSHKPGT